MTIIQNYSAKEKMNIVRQLLIDTYYRLTICRKYGHHFQLVEGYTDLERIYTSSKLDSYYHCIICNKQIDIFDLDLVAK